MASQYKSPSLMLSSSALFFASASICLALGPVYWYTGSSLLTPLRTAKILLLVTLAALCFSDVVKRGRTVRVNRTVLYPFISVILIAFISSFRETAVGVVWNYMASFVVPLFVIGIFSWAACREFPVWSALRWAARLFAILAIPVSLAAYAGFPQWQNPFQQPEQWLYQTGFGGSRTGWGVGCGFMLPFLFLDLISAKRVLPRVFSLLLLIGVVLSLLVTSGRGGVVGSFIVFTVMILFSTRGDMFQRGTYLACFFALALPALFVFSEELRFTTILEGDFRGAGGARIDANQAALRSVDGSILATGMGPAGLDLTRMGFEFESVHNLWINLLLESGVFMVLGVATIFLGLVWELYQRKSALRSVHPALSAVLLSMLLLALHFSLIEPRSVFGQFFNALMFWAAMGSMVGVSGRNSKANGLAR